MQQTARHHGLDAGAFGRLNQLDADIIGSVQEGYPRTVRHLHGTFLQFRAELAEAGDVGFEVGALEGDVLQAVMRRGVAGTKLLVRTRARDGDREAVLGGTADEAIAEHARLIAHDLEGERLLPPLGGFARVGRLDVDVVDAAAIQVFLLLTEHIRVAAHGDRLSGDGLGARPKR